MRVVGVGALKLSSSNLEFTRMNEGLHGRGCSGHGTKLKALGRSAQSTPALGFAARNAGVGHRELDGLKDVERHRPVQCLPRVHRRGKGRQRPHLLLGGGALLVRRGDEWLYVAAADRSPARTARAAAEQRPAPATSLSHARILLSLGAPATSTRGRDGVAVGWDTGG